MSDENKSQYFAAIENVGDFGLALKGKKDQFYQELKATGYWYRANKSHYTNFGYDADVGTSNSDLTRTGPQGEIVRMGVNHYANIARHILNLTTSQRPSPQPIASNTDHRSYEQVVLAQGLLDYYAREKRVERVLKEAARYAILYGEGFVKSEWDEDSGMEYGKDESGGTKYEGDAKITALTPIDVPRDISKDSHNDHDWFMVRAPTNAHILQAKFPEVENILKQTRKSDADMIFRVGAKPQGQSDEIFIYEFFHKRCAALPAGRHAMFLDDGTVLYEGPLPYRTITIRRITPDEFIGTSHGHTPMFDLLCIQQALNALYSAVVTNQTTFGVQVVIAPKGHDLDYNMVARGLAFIEYDSKLGKPESLNLTHTPAEIFQFISQLESVMETLSGINSTLRGNPEASLKSGSALALVQSQAIQFSTGLQQSYAHLVEDVFTDLLNILKDFAKTKRVVNIVGSYNQHMLKSFTGDSLSEINRVVVDSGSALSKTLSGRMQIAQDLLSQKLITNVEEYLAVIDTGRTDPMLEGQRRELMLVRDENEKLAQGISVRALAVDAHRMHIQEHRCVLAKPEMRDPANDKMAQAAIAHLMEHIALLKTTDPNLLNLLGEQSLMLPPAAPEVAAGGTPKGGRETPQESVNLPQMETGQAPAPQMPGYPTNPMTNREWTPEDAGILLENGSTM